MSEAKDIAKYFYKRGNKRFNPKQLQKLTYYAYVWYLVEYGEPLFAENPVMIKGYESPIFQSLESVLNECNGNMDRVESANLFENRKMNRFLNTIYITYGKYSGNILEQYIRSSKTFEIARKKLRHTSIYRIGVDDIYAHYGRNVKNNIKSIPTTRAIKKI